MKSHLILAFLLLVICTVGLRADDLDVIEGKLDAGDPKRMLETHLSGIARKASVRRELAR